MRYLSLSTISIVLLLNAGAASAFSLNPLTEDDFASASSLGDLFADRSVPRVPMPPVQHLEDGFDVTAHYPSVESLLYASEHADAVCNARCRGFARILNALAAGRVETVFLDAERDCEPLRDEGLDCLVTQRYAAASVPMWRAFHTFTLEVIGR